MALNLFPRSAVETPQYEPWSELYWYARMLIASDKYGGIGTNSRLMGELAACLKSVARTVSGEPQATQLSALATALENLLTRQTSAPKKSALIRRLLDDLVPRLVSTKHFEVLAATCELVMAPINGALDVIPNDDRCYAEEAARALLQTKGEHGLNLVINLWDDIGSYGCLQVERVQVVNLYASLRDQVSEMGLSPQEQSLVLTAFCQEYERRVAQKRKGRAGRGLESVTSFILDYYGVKGSLAPEHFTTGMEIDRWVRAQDGWLIGISCKRTLRERWKQAYTTDMNVLNRHKIKALWHVLTYDRDLSDDKLTEMGSYKAVFYLPEASDRFKSAAGHTGMKDYVRPMSSFISDLRAETGRL